MSGFKWFHVVAVAIVSFVYVPKAHALQSNWVGDKRVAVRLITASDSTSGDTLIAGLEFRYEPGWHGYWRTPGDAGIAPQFNWTNSENLAGEQVAWPAPKRLEIDGLQNSIYSGDFVLPAILHLAESDAKTNVSVVVDYAACAQICVPEHARLDLSIEPGTAARSIEADLIAKASAKVPGSPESSGIQASEIFFENDGAQRFLVLSLHSKSIPFDSPDLFVEGAGGGLPPAPRMEFDDGRQGAKFSVLLPDNLILPAALTLTFVDGDRSFEFQVPPNAVRFSPRDKSELPIILGIALIGGLILNLMPCVLPVLSIKLFGLASHAGQEAPAVRRDAAATASGIIACFVLLAICLLGLKMTGAALGWGIQFQQPWFLAGMTTLTFLFAASFFDWLTIPPLPGLTSFGFGRTQGSKVSAFLNGVFSTLLATPCSAPFVGTAAGFAFARGPVEILAVFFCLGIGMAVPFLAIAARPELSAWLPRPGPWMEWLRRSLGILLLATGLWLLAVLSSLSGLTTAFAVGMTATTMLGLLRLAARRSSGRSLWSAISVVALSFAAVLITIYPPFARPQKHAGAEQYWQAFDPYAIQPLVASGKIILVDVTAGWCLTCKVNELTSFSSQAVEMAIAGDQVVRMRADWSRPDPLIDAYLRSFGRVGVPFDAVYGPQQPAGLALPEILTPSIILKALNDAREGSGS
jgi:suppressor for copper-sensitivity B